MLAVSMMHWTMATVFIIHTISLASSSGPPDGGNEMVPPSCGGQKNQVLLEKCIRIGTHFLKEYLKRLGKGRLFDTCNHYSEFQECIKCPYISGWLHKDWLPVIKQLNCACQENESCRADLDCFEQEYQGIMVKHCDQVFKFNLQQKTKGRCFFLQDNLTCKVALVTSRCGRASGTFAYHVNSILAQAQSSNQQCSLSQHLSFKDYFVYDPNCPIIFLGDMATCSYQHLSGAHQHLEFHHDNDLVAEGHRQDVRKACSSYREYKLCMRPIKKACRRGTDIVYSSESQLRKYVLKMEYICKKSHKEVYGNHLSCYQDVLYNQTLEECSYIWKSLAPLLTKVTSQEFYCSKTSTTVGKLKQELAHLRTCYEEVFQRRCGTDAGELMGALISLAFEDPHYLRFDFKPDCITHGSKPSRRQTTTTLLATTTFIPQTSNLQLSEGSLLGSKTASSGINRLSLSLCHPLIILLMWIMSRFRWR